MVLYFIIYNLDFMDEDTGTKRLISSVFKELEKEYDQDLEVLWSRIEDLVIKVISKY